MADFSVTQVPGSTTTRQVTGTSAAPANSAPRVDTTTQPATRQGQSPAAAAYLNNTLANVQAARSLPPGATDWNAYINGTDPAPPQGPSQTPGQRPAGGTDWNAYINGTDAPPSVPLKLGFGQTRTAQSLWGKDAQVLSDGSREPGAPVREGDVVKYTRNGQVVTQTLTADQALDFNFRSNVVQNCHQYDERAAQGQKWMFNDNPSPILMDSQSNRVNENQYWRIVPKEGRNPDGSTVTNNVLELKPGVNASDAMRDMFKNPRQYGMDCATAAHVMNLKATLDTVGDRAFNRRFNQGTGTDLFLFSHFNVLDGKDDSGWAQGTYDRPMVPSNDPNRPGSMQNQAYDPNNRNDPILPGDRRWYVHPGDAHTGGQGWNVISLGRNANGVEEFWHIPLANHTHGAFADRTPGRTAGNNSVDDTSMYQEYLTDLRNHPNLAALQAMINGS
jgi:hypothetical protein